MADAGRDGMAEALESVAEAAAKARAEIGRLVELLGGEPPSGTSPGLPMVGELVRRAGATGLAVTCRFLVSGDHLAPAASEAAYRVVQEALTNALKHAPDAPVDITVSGCDGEVEVDIVNAPRQVPSSLERSGGGFGLTGMRDRIAAWRPADLGADSSRGLAGVGAASGRPDGIAPRRAPIHRRGGYVGMAGSRIPACRSWQKRRCRAE